MKTCSQCGLEKPKEEFDFHKERNSFVSYCKACRRVKQNSFNKTPERKERIKAYARKYKLMHPKPLGYWFAQLKKRRERIKREYNIGSGFLARYGLSTCLTVFERCGRECNECGSLEDLTFHHLDGMGRKYEVKKQRYLMNNNPDNLVVLCRRCHGRIEGRKSVIVMGKKPSWVD